ncbi:MULTISPECIES: heme utilization cystosolic carrier protein HutX [Vibrio]|uniref:Heme utilization cystosolic carrier protein HutX n=2 Tax=Vibrio TaxID=662 RepID=A0A7X4LJF8_9VIBR|nr:MULTISPECIES: heme utilization cystosolic carrier protein HutX [Vibrio]MBF9002889.1 heme utilization cystosolic carrier protein HutX [Vibrio nitrifigilis]MZI92870.1 heme utilization cystosolic carrier protein HutX [Vibrio eleionomae]
MSIESKVAEALEENPRALPSDIAKQLQVSEKEVVAAFPAEMARLIDGCHAEQILTTIADWQTSVTVIVHSGGSIFEIKAPLPKGSFARGYFNLMGEAGQLHGHLLLDNVAHIALVSKAFMGKESHYFGFFDPQGDSIFKIYLGRDENRQLIPAQVEAFQKLKNNTNF